MLKRQKMNAIRVENVSKTFVLHQQNGVRLPVLQNASLEVNRGECVVLVAGTVEVFNPKLGAAIAAVLAARASRNPWLPFVAGMAALWGLRWVGGG